MKYLIFKDNYEGGIDPIGYADTEEEAKQLIEKFDDFYTYFKIEKIDLDEEYVFKVNFNQIIDKDFVVKEEHLVTWPIPYIKYVSFRVEGTTWEKIKRVNLQLEVKAKNNKEAKLKALPLLQKELDKIKYGI